MKGLIRFNTDYLKDANNDTKWRFIDADGKEHKVPHINTGKCECFTESCNVLVDGEMKLKHHIAVRYKRFEVCDQGGIHLYP